MRLGGCWWRVSDHRAGLQPEITTHTHTHHLVLLQHLHTLISEHMLSAGQQADFTLTPSHTYVRTLKHTDTHSPTPAGYQTKAGRPGNMNLINKPPIGQYGGEKNGATERAMEHASSRRSVSVCVQVGSRPWLCL